MVNFNSVKFGVFFATLTLLFSYSLGMYYGIANDSIKAQRKATVKVHAEDFKNNAKKMDGAIETSSKYMKRAHLHGGAIGAGTLALCLALGLFVKNIFGFSEGFTNNIKTLLSIALGLGGTLYSVYWLVVSYGVLEVADKHEVKEAYAWMVYLGAGPMYLATLATTILILLNCFCCKKD